MQLKEIFVALGLEVDEAAFAKGQIAASLVEAGMRKIVEIGVETARAFIENTKEAIEYGDHMRKTSQSVGVAVEALQELQYAGQMSGISAEEMNQSIAILTRTMNAAKGGSKEQAEAFSKLGIKVQDSSGHLRGADEVLTDVAAKLAPMKDGAEKTALAMQFFGKSGAKMVPLLNEGAEGIAKLREEAEAMGLVMSDDATRSAEELGDNLDRLGSLSKGLWRQAIAPLLPAMNELVEKFLAWRKENAQLMAGRLREFMGTLLGAVKGVGEAFMFLYKNSAMVKTILGATGITMAVIALTTQIARMSVVSTIAAAKAAASWALAAAPFVAIGAAIAAMMLLFDDYRVYKEGGVSVYGEFKDQIDDFLKPKEGEWFLVSWIKQALALLRDTLDVLTEIDNLTGFTDTNRAATLKKIDARSGKSDKEMQAQRDAMQMQTARTQAGAGVPLSKASQDALKRAGVSQESFTAKYRGQAGADAGYSPSVVAPSVAAPAAAGGTVNVQPVINVTQREGEDGMALADRVGTIFKQMFQAEAGNAVAGIRGGR